MKKILVGLILLSFVFSANTKIRPGNTGGRITSGYEFFQMEVINQEAPTANALVWYADNMAGYSIVAIEGIEVSTGNVPTTISAQALYSNGSAVSVAAQTITAGTDLTDFKSTYYKFTLPAYSVTRNVSFNFQLLD